MGILKKAKVTMLLQVHTEYFKYMSVYHINHIKVIWYNNIGTAQFLGFKGQKKLKFILFNFMCIFSEFGLSLYHIHLSL